MSKTWLSKVKESVAKGLKTVEAVNKAVLAVRHAKKNTTDAAPAAKFKSPDAGAYSAGAAGAVAKFKSPNHGAYSAGAAGATAPPTKFLGAIARQIKDAITPGDDHTMSRKQFIKEGSGFKMSLGNDSPLKHTVDAKGKPKGKSHLAKHKANYWGPEGHGDRSFSGIVAKGVNTAKNVVEDVKEEVKEIKKKIN